MQKTSVILLYIHYFKNNKKKIWKRKKKMKNIVDKKSIDFAENGIKQLIDFK